MWDDWQSPEYDYSNPAWYFITICKNAYKGFNYSLTHTFNSPPGKDRGGYNYKAI
jgi:hypothetical protein